MRFEKSKSTKMRLLPGTSMGELRALPDPVFWEGGSSRGEKGERRERVKKKKEKEEMGPGVLSGLKDEFLATLKPNIHSSRNFY